MAPTRTDSMAEDERQIEATWPQEMLVAIRELTTTVSRLEASQAGIRRILNEMRDLLAGETSP